MTATVFQESAWDALAGPDRPLAQERFARCVERGGVEGTRFRRHLQRDASGRAVLAAELSRLDVRLDLLSPTPFRRGIAGVRSVWPGFLRVPVLFAGLPASFAQPGVRLADGLGGAERQSAVQTLVDAMEAQAEGWRTPLLCLKEFTTPEADALAPALESRGFLRLPSLPGVRLDLPDSFDAYRQSMRAGYRRQLDADLAARDRLRLRRVERWGAHAETFAALYARVMDRAPYQLERFGPSFVAALAEAFAEDSALLILDDPQQEAAGPLAMALVLYGSETAVFLLAGLDYGRAGASRAYPALVASVIEDAIAQGCRAVELGQTSYALKMRFGGVPSDRWLFLRAWSAGWHRFLRHAGPHLFPTWDLPPRRVFRSGS